MARFLKIRVYGESKQEGRVYVPVFILTIIICLSVTVYGAINLFTLLFFNDEGIPQDKLSKMIYEKKKELEVKEKKGDFHRMETMLSRKVEDKRSAAKMVHLTDVRMNITKTDGSTGIVSFSILLECDSPKTALRAQSQHPILYDAIIGEVQNVREEMIRSSKGKKEIQEKMKRILNEKMRIGRIHNIYFDKIVFK